MAYTVYCLLPCFDCVLMDLMARLALCLVMMDSSVTADFSNRRDPVQRPDKFVDPPGAHRDHSFS